MGSAVTLILIVVVIVLLFVLPYRRQAQRQREVRSMQAALQPGAEVMTTSGLFGTVIAVEETLVELEIAPGIVIRVARGAIGEVRSTGAAVEGEYAAGELEADDGEYADDGPDEETDGEYAEEDDEEYADGTDPEPEDEGPQDGTSSPRDDRPS